MALKQMVQPETKAEMAAFGKVETPHAPTFITAMTFFKCFETNLNRKTMEGSLIRQMCSP